MIECFDEAAAVYRGAGEGMAKEFGEVEEFIEEHEGVI
jgi:hypothetical protein